VGLWDKVKSRWYTACSQCGNEVKLSETFGEPFDTGQLWLMTHPGQLHGTQAARNEAARVGKAVAYCSTCFESGYALLPSVVEERRREAETRAETGRQILELSRAGIHLGDLPDGATFFRSAEGHVVVRTREQ
jgi:hypothetical protein